MPTLNVKAYRYVFPVKAIVTLVDNDFWAKGDVNRDGYIDASDLDLVMAAFGSTPGKPNWNPDCDLNGDGRVDMGDVGIVSGNMGLKPREYVTPFITDVSVGKCTLIGRYKAQTAKTELEMTEANTKKVTLMFWTLLKPTVRIT
jgi:hypothetical protein